MSRFVATISAMRTTRMNEFVDALVGLAAGVVATAPMTVLMRRLHRRLPPHERYPLPPQQITARLARSVGLNAGVRNPQAWEIKTHVAHYGYGAACGGVYALVEPHLPGRHAVAKGAIFGLGVWTISYLGLLPAARILPPATRDYRERNAVMIAAHLVYGTALALAFNACRRRSRRRVRRAA